eukprot:TRINITY_DN7500_c0_g1_i1.p1 TRINITY_DN7500_c0_g1~~TRINITY_DN7500_c0_g1_i1.p1  ORF type:complete len:220 (-),score=56.79 TRINITY_DN7500_c0_g1_i1:11-670(-)
MQENLKKAFMRGVCALNLEAMSALNPENVDFLGESVEQEMPISNRIPIPPLTEMSMQSSQCENTIEPPTVPMISIPKIESKDHMWKPAPILAKDFSSTSVRPLAFNPTLPRPEPFLRADPLFDGRREVIVGEDEKDIRCERVPYEASEVEGVEARSFGMAKQPVNVYQPLEIPTGPAVQPETKVIRVNKFGKSYAEGGLSSAKYKPPTTNKKKANQFKK